MKLSVNTVLYNGKGDLELVSALNDGMVLDGSGDNGMMVVSNGFGLFESDVKMNRDGSCMMMVWQQEG